MKRNSAAMLLLLVSMLARAASAQTSGTPVRFHLDKPGYVTLVIEDEQGNRVCNLLSEAYLPAGDQTAIWDGYDVGDIDGKGDLIRHRAAPGLYRVRGLVHDRLSLRYEFSVNSPGTPPWKTKDGTGAWLADHSASGDVLWLPEGVALPNGKGPAHLLVCAISGESGEEFVWLNAEGRRLYGMNTGFWGGSHLARDPGSNPVPNYYAYTFMSGERDADNNTLEVRGFTSGGELQTVAKWTYPLALKQTTLPAFRTEQENYGNNGLAVYNGLIVVAWTRMNRLVFADARQRKVLGEVSLTSPRGPVFDAQGRLYVITGNQVKRFRIPTGTPRLTEATTRIASGLEDPRRLALDRAGNLYVSDWGRSHQVKVFNSEGKWVRSLGKPGGPQLGLYDPHRMSSPSGVTVDDTGRLWLTEAESYPKRLSVWNSSNGTLLKAWYGGPKYGGGGALDPQDKSRFYYAEYERGGGTEFALDWKDGTSQPKAIYWRSGSTAAEPMPGPAPERAFYAGGFQYLTNCYNGQLRFNQDRGIGIWRMDRDHIARPVAIIANAADLNNTIWGFPMRNKEAINALWKGQDPAHILFVWCDRNGDGIAQPEEVQWMATARTNSQGQILPDMGLMPLVYSDLSFTTSYGTWIAPPKIGPHGELTYDLHAQKIVGDATQQRSPLIAGGWTEAGHDGSGALFGADLAGKAHWKYLDTPEEQLGAPGLIVGPSRILGPPVKPTVGQADSFFALEGEKGTVFLITMDGLFLQTLGGDARTTPLWRMPEAKRGMHIDDVSFEDEHFHPTINQVADGTIYLVAGKEHSSLLKLDGLETVRREAFGTITLTPQSVEALPETRTLAARKTGRNELTVALRTEAPELHGDPSNWPADTQWAPIGDNASAAVLFTHDTLYAAYRLNDANFLQSSGGDFRSLFKKGGALDLMLGTNSDADRNRQEPVAGDLRLLVTQVQGKTKAVLYRAVAPGASPEEGADFASPIGKVHFAQVLDVSDKVTLTQSGGNFEIAVPLSLLGFAPRSGLEVLGDLGVLRGDGAQTIRRVYWNNQNALIVSDLPSEARLQPAQWGLWKIQ